MNKIILTKDSVILGLSGIVTFVNGKGLRIHCKAGCLWITVEKDVTDYWLKSDETMEVQLAGRVVIQAMAQASELNIEPYQSDYSIAIRAEAFC